VPGRRGVASPEVAQEPSTPALTSVRVRPGAWVSLDGIPRQLDLSQPGPRSADRPRRPELRQHLGRRQSRNRKRPRDGRTPAHQEQRRLRTLGTPLGLQSRRASPLHPVSNTAPISATRTSRLQPPPDSRGSRASSSAAAGAETDHQHTDLPSPRAPRGFFFGPWLPDPGLAPRGYGESPSFAGRPAAHAIVLSDPIFLDSGKPYPILKRMN
jgi:hypothetical protein